MRPDESDWRLSVYEKNQGQERAPVRAQIVGLTFTEKVPGLKLVHWLEQQVQRESSPLVQLIMAGISQRIPIEYCWNVASRLAQKVFAEEDRNLVLMIWYGLEPLVEAHPEGGGRCQCFTFDIFSSPSNLLVCLESYASSIQEVCIKC